MRSLSRVVAPLHGRSSLCLLATPMTTHLAPSPPLASARGMAAFASGITANIPRTRHLTQMAANQTKALMSAFA